MPVYFIQAGEAGPVKIGKADEPMDRLAMLQCGNPEPLRLIRTVEGGRKQEAWLHGHYSSLRVRGEWFRFCPTMLTVEPLAPAPVEQPARAAGFANEVIAACGGCAAIARWTGAPLSTVSYWGLRDSIPVGRWAELIALAAQNGHVLTLDMFTRQRAPRRVRSVEATP